MLKHLGKVVVFGTVLALTVGPAIAQGRGNGGGAGMRVGTSDNANLGGQSGANGRFGGQSDWKLSATGRASSNGPNAPDRDFGQDRAADAARDANKRSAAASNSASDLGSLNAAHASDNARADAASGSAVGETAAYETQMKAALAISNPAQRNAAITNARQQLAQNSNKPLTAGAIAQLDSTLNIQGASPQLGASQ